MPAVYLTERIQKAAVKRLRKYERANHLTPSITQTIEHLLDVAERFQELTK
jgi:hypothetical protein